MKKDTKNCHHSSSESLSIDPHFVNSFFICPMHENIRQKGPGECSICGMALELETITALDTENPELTDFRRRFWVGLLLTAPIFLLEMGSHIFHLNTLVSNTVSSFIQLFFSIPVIFWAGLPFFKRGLKSVQSRHLNMFTLVSMGVSVAFAYSLIAVLFPNLFPISMQNNDGTVPIYFEAASVIVVLVLLGQMLELKARESTSGAIKALLNLAPKKAMRITTDGDEEINIEDINRGDILRIHPGEKIPVDGNVVEGESYIDESMVTGEPVPILKAINAAVISGTLNGNGALIVKAEKVGKETLLSSIIHMVAKAQRSRAPIQRMADAVSGWFVPIVILMAILAFVLWVIFAETQGFTYGLIAAVSVLIIACPCALGLATPMSIMVGIGRGAKQGILIKNAQSLEILEKVDTLIVDKTGTLTEGHPKLTDIHAVDSISEMDVLQLAASLEQNSEHPLARAIVQDAKNKDITPQKVENFKAITGKGIAGTIDNKHVDLGNVALMTDLNIAIDYMQDRANAIRREGATVMFVALQNKAIGFIAVNDPIKETTLQTLTDLKKSGIQIVMLTGDNAVTAKSVAGKLGITKFYADVLPQDKYRIVEEYRKKGLIVAMAGDGINDAPALAAAHVGIAMGTGTDVAIESAGVTLLKGDLSKIIQAISLSRAVMNNIRQNLFFAFFYNAAGVPIAAGALYPMFGILLSPIFAAAAMSLSSLSVIMNALRLHFKRI